MTQKKDTKAVYAIYLDTTDSITLNDTISKKLPESFIVKGIFAAQNAKVSLLGSTGNLKWENTSEGVKIYIPEKIRKNLPCDLAWAVKISGIQ